MKKHNNMQVGSSSPTLHLSKGGQSVLINLSKKAISFLRPFVSHGLTREKMLTTILGKSGVKIGPWFPNVADGIIFTPTTNRHYNITLIFGPKPSVAKCTNGWALEQATKLKLQRVPPEAVFCLVDSLVSNRFILSSFFKRVVIMHPEVVCGADVCNRILSVSLDTCELSGMMSGPGVEWDEKTVFAFLNTKSIR